MQTMLIVQPHLNMYLLSLIKRGRGGGRQIEEFVLLSQCSGGHAFRSPGIRFCAIFEVQCHSIVSRMVPHLLGTRVHDYRRNFKQF